MSEERLKMQTANKVDKNIEIIGKLFPNTLTEVIKDTDSYGKPIVEKAIDFDILRQELSKVIVEGPEERYQMNWPDKRKSILLANQSSNKTLRPCREESVDFDNTENLYIEGDNLEVLKLLQETYLNRVKMIYIDPPYNTGNDSFVYDDDFKMGTGEFGEASGQYDEDGNMMFDLRANSESNGRFHTDWLNMMYSRLRLAKDLLTEDGVIFISIDDNEIRNIRYICDEIFGEVNFIAQVIVQANKGGQDYLQLAKTHEYILIYARSEQTKINLLEKDDTSAFKFVDAKGKFEIREVRNRNPKFGKWNRPNLFYPYYVNPKSKDKDGFCAVSLNQDAEHSIEVYPYNSMGKESCWRWGKELAAKNIVYNDMQNSNLIARQKNDGGWNIYEKNRKTLTKAKTLWDETEVRTERGTIVFRELFKESYFDHPKPVELIYKCLMLGSNSEDIILDFFSGSATTAHAIMQLNIEENSKRKFIMVQLPEETDEKSEAYKAGYKTICEIGKERIRRAGQKIKEENPDKAKDLDTGFRVLKLDSSNMKGVYYIPGEYSQATLGMFEDNIKEDRSAEDLLFQVMLELDELLSSDIKEMMIAGKKVFNVAGGNIIACFDTGITEEVVIEIAKMQPYYAVFRDNCMASDSVTTNFEQIFKTYSPSTVRKVL